MKEEKEIKRIQDIYFLNNDLYILDESNKLWKFTNVELVNNQPKEIEVEFNFNKEGEN